MKEEYKKIVDENIKRELNNELYESTKPFIKKCHVLPLVSACEGGFVELNSILADFAKNESTKEYWFKMFESKFKECFENNGNYRSFDDWFKKEKNKLYQ